MNIYRMNRLGLNKNQNIREGRDQLSVASNTRKQLRSYENVFASLLQPEVKHARLEHVNWKLPLAVALSNLGRRHRVPDKRQSLSEAC